MSCAEILVEQSNPLHHNSVGVLSLIDSADKRNAGRFWLLMHRRRKVDHISYKSTTATQRHKCRSQLKLFKLWLKVSKKLIKNFLKACDSFTPIVVLRLKPRICTSVVLNKLGPGTVAQ